MAQTPPRGISILQRRLSLSEMLDVPGFTDVVKNFVELYRIGIKVFDERGAKLADVKIGNGDFCGYVFSFADGRQRCTATVARVKDGPIATTHGARLPVLSDDDGPRARSMVTVPCFTGLRYLIMPVTWEGDPMGRIVFGPFLPEDLKEFPQSLLDISSGLDVTNAQALVEKVRRAPESAVVKVILHFATLFDTMVASGQKMFLTSQMHVEATLESNRDLESRNNQLEAMNTKLKELDRLKSAFLATVSHELRTPLTSIIGYSEMLAEGLAGPMNQEQVDYVRTIMEKGETLLKLISSILDISQIEAGKVRLAFEPVEITEVVATSISSVKPQAAKKGVTVEAKIPEGLKVRAFADKDRLRQVVVNLLANAVKFTGKGGKVTAFLSELAPQPELNAEGYRIIVEDSGVGIPADQFDKIFQSFYQVDSSSTREFGGAGLGLSIVKSFVEGHGGVVRVTSEMGKGSRFSAILPLQPPQPSAYVPPPLAPSSAGEADERF
ncbi:MAG: PocR ligand-binding domain-containing protein [Myxococcaceae bacterium]|nr:PocR ligand-binding domain-containing protein [Myxococcaceae bacterium]